MSIRFRHILYSHDGISTERKIGKYSIIPYHNFACNSKI